MYTSLLHNEFFYISLNHMAYDEQQIYLHSHRVYPKPLGIQNRNNLANYNRSFAHENICVLFVRVFRRKCNKRECLINVKFKRAEREDARVTPRTPKFRIGGSEPKNVLVFVNVWQDVRIYASDNCSQKRYYRSTPRITSSKQKKISRRMEMQF